MNGSLEPSTTTPAAVSYTIDAREADASCATPVSLMFFASTAWLVVSAVLALIASVKLHSPAIMANSAALSYGHLRPAANDAFVYGFASQAGLAVALWMLCRLGRTRLWAPLGIAIATLFWNFAVGLGLVGVFRGDTTGFEWFEFPAYASTIFFCAYTVIGVCALVTFSRRTVEELFPSQWYILAALLWLPWIYATASVLLICHPVRGAMQFLINGWFVNGLFTLWLGALGVAVLYYFIPKLTAGQAVYSRALAVLGFWSLAAFAPWIAVYSGVPLPSWIVSVSVAAAVLTLLPLAATVINLWATRRGGALECSRVWFTTSLVFLAVSGVIAALVPMCPISAVTVVADASQVLTLYGFVGFALFGAIYYIAPRLMLDETKCGARGKVTWWCNLLGILFFSGALLIGGMVQGRKLLDGSIPFVTVMNSLKPFLRVSTLGLLLLLVGNISLFANVLKMLSDCCRNCCCPDDSAKAQARLKPAKAR